MAVGRVRVCVVCCRGRSQFSIQPKRKNKKPVRSLIPLDCVEFLTFWRKDPRLYILKRNISSSLADVKRFELSQLYRLLTCVFCRLSRWRMAVAIAGSFVNRGIINEWGRISWTLGPRKKDKNKNKSYLKKKKKPSNSIAGTVDCRVYLSDFWFVCVRARVLGSFYFIFIFF